MWRFSGELGISKLRVTYIFSYWLLMVLYVFITVHDAESDRHSWSHGDDVASPGQASD